MNYGCCKCQCRHYSVDPLYQSHMIHMSKHGFMHSDQHEPYRPEHLRCECGAPIQKVGQTLCPACERAEIHSLQVDAMHRDNDREAIGQIPPRWINAE